MKICEEKKRQESVSITDMPIGSVFKIHDDIIAMPVKSSKGYKMIIDLDTGEQLQGHETVCEPLPDAVLIPEGIPDKNPKNEAVSEIGNDYMIRQGDVGEKPSERKLIDVPLGGVCRVNLKAQNISRSELNDVIIAIRTQSYNKEHAEVIDLATGTSLLIPRNTPVKYLPGALMPVYKDIT